MFIFRTTIYFDFAIRFYETYTNRESIKTELISIVDIYTYHILNQLLYIMSVAATKEHLLSIRPLIDTDATIE